MSKEKEEVTRKMKEFLNPSPVAVEEKPDQESQVIQDVREESLPTDAEWVKRVTKTMKTTVVRCIVIDKDDRWHQEAMVDLKGADTSAYAWGYYGTNFPVLVEDDQGNLHPWLFKDQVGENSNRLYKGANPEGYKATFKHHFSILQKVQVGLMVVLILGMFFLMFVLINN